MYSYLYRILVDDSTDPSLVDGTSILKTPNVQLMYHLFAFILGYSSQYSKASGRRTHSGKTNHRSLHQDSCEDVADTNSHEA